MIKVDKEVVITISGDDVHILSEICEMARVHIHERKQEYLKVNRVDDSRFAGFVGLTPGQLIHVHQVLNRLFDAGK